MRTAVLLPIAVLLAGFHDAGSGLTIEVPVITSRDAISLNRDASGTRFVVPGGRDWSLTNEPGKPALPVRIVRVLLPPRTRVAGLTASSSGGSEFSRTTDVVRAPVPEAPADGRIRRDDAVFGRDIPEKTATYLGTGRWRGFSIASFAVLPVSWHGTQASLHERVTLHIELEAGVPADDQCRPAARVTPRYDGTAENSVARMVVNPEALSGYPRARVDAPGGRDFQPSPAPSLEGSPVEYLIVSPDSFATQWQRLADWKTARGVPTVVRTLGAIESTGRRGSDLQETIRLYIREAREKWGIRYVLLGGDTGQVPARFAYTTYYYGGTQIPTDMYYACLDGSWNDDHDGYWGELPDDAPDLYADVYVGRLTTESALEVDNMVDKIISYETPADTSSVSRGLFLAEVLFPAPWDPGDPIQDDGAAHAEFVYSKNMSGSGLTIDRLYENYTNFPGSLPESRQAAIDSIDSGYGFVLHYGHGYRFNMHVADDNILSPDADAFSNTDRYSNLFMVNCTAAAIDFDCLAEHMLSNPSGGMVSVVGSSNSAFANVATRYADEYTRIVFATDEVHIGPAFHDSRLARTPLALFSDNIDLWTHYIYTLLADPEMALFTGPALPLTVTYPDTITTGISTIPVSVTRGGIPADSVLICAWKPGEDYEVYTTDAAGSVNIPFRADTPGTVGLVASARNSIRASQSITVVDGPGALLSFSGIAIDDGVAPGTAGGGDGIIDAGETVDALLSVSNTGTSPSLPGVATLSTSSPWVGVPNPSAVIGGLSPGMAADAFNPWRVTIDPGTPDGTVVDFAVMMATPADTTVDTFSRVVYAPSPAITLIRTDDSPGDGNGIIAPGEPYLLYLAIKNYGGGLASSLSGTLQTLGSGAVITNGTASWGDLAPLGEAENAVGFGLSETSVFVENPVELTLTDGNGHTWIDTLEFRVPGPPAALQFDPSLGVDRMGIEWTASSSPDVAGYMVYRSATPGGPYSRVSPDVVDHALFVDSGLQPSTPYYYVATAVDSSGNQSVYSAEGAGSTNPPQAPGWPNLLPSSTSSSPAVGDIDGDGDLEVVIGSDQMYAWHHDGSELRDGDGQPLTWGVLNTAGVDFLAPPTLAEFDFTQGLEIVAPSYTGKEMYIFDSLGQTRPGWPQPTYDNMRAAVAVGDIDGDWMNEIVGIDQNGWLYAWNDDGTELFDGDADTSTVGVLRRFPDTPWWQVQSPALADIDTDGRSEILVATQDSMLYVLNEDGSDVPGWPYALSGFAGGGIAVGDIDGDGDLEIVVPSRSGVILALHHDGTTLWQRFLPQNLFFNPSPALADFDGDGTLETVLPSSAGSIYMFDVTGTYVSGWPVSYGVAGTESSPIIADLDGDGGLDVAIGNEEMQVWAWNASGQQLDGFPLMVGDAIRGTPVACDADGDGDVEIAVASFDRKVYMWDLPGVWSVDRAPWPSLHANTYHTGSYPGALPTGVEQTPRVPERNSLYANYPNPFNPSTSIAFDVGPGPPRRVVVSIYNVKGARIQTLFDGTLGPGVYRRAWDGRNRNGQRVGSGIYFYRLRAGSRVVATRKMVLLK